eukprot:TRINITY_DN1589_c0_g1_i1.p2 TRINITY_DN1589_c0_g1~~TRINITY_DN1589_c0_g1_i1.p2  ORF type:complete len:161 (+),score=19.85 TRINITY_DN1589_c0_g1_i1:25-483(+)
MQYSSGESSPVSYSHSDSSSPIGRFVSFEPMLNEQLATGGDEKTFQSWNEVDGVDDLEMGEVSERERGKKQIRKPKERSKKYSLSEPTNGKMVGGDDGSEATRQKPKATEILYCKEIERGREGEREGERERGGEGERGEGTELTQLLQCKEV